MALPRSAPIKMSDGRVIGRIFIEDSESTVIHGLATDALTSTLGSAATCALMSD
jgi:hypothetical protein